MSGRTVGVGIGRAVRVVGPGLVFAGAAIGVSHLVQATRAGAGFGLAMLLVVVGAHALKYPALSVAPRYVSATGRSLLEAYRDQGRWAVVAFGVVQVGTMFTIVGAVTLVTAQVVAVVVPGMSGWSVAWVSAGVLAACGGVMAAGGFGSLVWAVSWCSIAVFLVAAVRYVPC